MLTTLLPIDRGQATVAGFDVNGQPHEVRRRIGYVSQLGGADELATGRENLILQARLYGAGLAEAARRADELSELLDLGPFLPRKVITYSGGQRRRLDVALGIVHHPDVLFLDEPSTGLDTQNRVNLWDHIRALRQQGTSVVLTTHYLEEADELCDRVTIIDMGRIVAEGPPRELKRAVGGDSVLLTLHEGETKRAREQLQHQPFVRELTTEGTQLRLYVDDGGAATPLILRLLDQEQIDLRSMRLSEPTLDDVFLRHTGRSLRDGEAATPAEVAA
jgi:ABC-2 type transport system ATP-binding protein